MRYLRFAPVKAHFRNWRQWELNPVVVKELRQAVRSWAVTGMLLLFLVVLFIASLGLLIGQSFAVSANQRLGAAVFSWFLSILTVSSIVFIPLYVGVRLAVERQESNLDLLYISALTPGRIIRGKFFCGAYMTVLFFSACMPFMAFSNLLRGVDLPTIAFILLFLFFVVCAAIQIAIFLACLPISKPLKILLALLGIGLALATVSPLIFFSLMMMRSGVGAMMAGREFWIAFVSWAGVLLGLLLLLYFLSVALISPASANRALPVRVYLTVLWMFSGVLTFAWMRTQKDTRFLIPWAVLSFLVFLGALVVVISNYDRLSLRVRRRIPAGTLKRAVAFLFYNGAAGGLIWVGLLMGATYVITSWFLRNGPAWLPGYSTMSPTELVDFILSSQAIVTYVFAYALTALIVHRRLLGRRAPRLAGIIAILLPAVWAVIPNLAAFFLNRLSWRSVEERQLGNIFNIFVLRGEADKKAHLVCAIVWLLLMMVLNAKWFVQQVRNFRPLDRANAPQPPVIRDNPPPLPAAPN